MQSRHRSPSALGHVLVRSAPSSLRVQEQLSGLRVTVGAQLVSRWTELLWIAAPIAGYLGWVAGAQHVAIQTLLWGFPLLILGILGAFGVLRRWESRVLAVSVTPDALVLDYPAPWRPAQRIALADVVSVALENGVLIVALQRRLVRVRGFGADAELVWMREVIRFACERADAGLAQHDKQRVLIAELQTGRIPSG